MKHSKSNILVTVSDTFVHNGWWCYILKEAEEIQQLPCSYSAYTWLGYYSLAGGHYTNPSMALLSKHLESTLDIWLDVF